MNERRLYRLWRDGGKDIESIAAHARDVAQERLEVRAAQDGGSAEEARRTQDQAVQQNTPRDLAATDARAEKERRSELGRDGPAGPPGGPGQPQPGVAPEPGPPNIDYEAAAHALDDVLDLLHEFKRGATPGRVRGVRRA